MRAPVQAEANKVSKILDVEILDHINDALGRVYYRVYYKRYGSTYSYLFVRELTGAVTAVSKSHHGRDHHTFVPGDERFEPPPDFVYDAAASLARPSGRTARW